MIINELKRQKFSLKRRVSECLSNKKMAPSHIIIVFVATAGQNGENLGSDEAQIVLFVYLLYDVSNNKVRHIFLHQIINTFTINEYVKCIRNTYSRRLWTETASSSFARCIHDVLLLVPCSKTPSRHASVRKRSRLAIDWVPPHQCVGVVQRFVRWSWLWCSLEKMSK